MIYSLGIFLRKRETRHWTTKAPDAGRVIESTRTDLQLAPGRRGLIFPLLLISDLATDRRSTQPRRNEYRACWPAKPVQVCARDADESDISSRLALARGR
jgi:hypothetical protein